MSILIDDDDEPPTTFLSCNSASNAEEMTGMDGIEPVDLAYDYEIHMMEDADLSSAVNDFEVGLLKAVGDEFDLITCRESVRRRSLRLVGVGSDPVDEEDSTHTECEVDVDSIESSKCTPMNGYMTAWVSETDNRRLSESDIYTAIETYTNNYAIAEGGVLAISYIGTRPAATLDADESIAAVPFISSATREDGTRDDLASTNPKMSPGAIAGIVIASSVVVALLTMVALIIVKKRRTMEDTEEREMSNDSNADNSLVMIDDDDEEQLSQFKEDMSKAAFHDDGDDDGDDDDTQDHSCDGTLPLDNTFESELVPNHTFETTEAGGGGDQDDEMGFEVNI
mmetsp:Transcript_31076/g.57595  ORF Transcript_31076/g.57595 Transcript_31076/m.57595 type:complete len:339 (+) Transcript_31076:222-1238(+)